MAKNGLNLAFNNFLMLGEDDKNLLIQYHAELVEGGEDFAQIFYNYLLAAPETAKILEDYKASGGSIKTLVRKQVKHLFGFLCGNLDEYSADQLAHIAAVHRRYNIEPVWIMGAYKLYLDHLKQRIKQCRTEHPRDKDALESAVVKYIFRDMGLMLEEYWESGLRMLEEEKEKVTAFQDQITSLLSNIPQLLWSVDTVRNTPIYVSPNSRNICGKDISLPIPCLEWTLPDDKDQVERAWAEALTGRVVEVESQVVTPSGERRWFRRKFCPYIDQQGQVVRIDGLMEDITEAKLIYERLNTLATTDSLTGLLNRALFHDRLTHALSFVERSRDEDYQLALLIMDLDHFKEVNDTLGHPVGDRILIEVAQRLKRVTRKTDSLARLGGDEFAVLIGHTKNAFHEAEVVASKIEDTFTKPFQIGSNEFFLGVSIGIAVYPDHGTELSTLLSRADVAMYHAKRFEQSFKFYQTGLDLSSHKNLQLSADLRYALTRDEFVVHYQPKIDFATGNVVGVEALIRWNHPEKGLVMPDDFIPLAERVGLINSITNWVLNSAARQSKKWLDSGLNLTVAVNVSVRSFQEASQDIVDDIGKVLSQFNVPPKCLELEITESLLMSDVQGISRSLVSINELGVRVAIDDFGTGYSSLAYLKSLPVSAIKIDKSFVMNMVKDDDDATIVQSTIAMAHNLGFNVIAEGVEDIETLNKLRHMGCDGGQGYYFSKPLPASEFEAWLADFARKKVVHIDEFHI